MSRLTAVRTRAVPAGDHYPLFGQKIYITWGGRHWWPGGEARRLGESDFCSAKRITIQFHMHHILNVTGSSGRFIRNGTAAVMALPVDRF